MTTQDQHDNNKTEMAQQRN